MDEHEKVGLDEDPYDPTEPVMRVTEGVEVSESMLEMAAGRPEREVKSAGTSVRTVEAALQNEVMLDPQYASDGIWDEHTTDALRQWQAEEFGEASPLVTGRPNLESLHAMAVRHGFKAIG